MELAREYTRRLLATLNLDDFGGLRLIELGAGDGAMSRALRERGAEVFAVEPYGYDGLLAQGIDAYRTLDDLPASSPFDGAVCLEVVEHLTAPWAELKKLRSTLKPSAWILVTTPNVTGLNARLNAEHWREARKPGHVVWFAPRTLELLLMRAGFPRCRRLKWHMGSRGSPARLPRWALQLLGLDGRLQYLAHAV